MVETSYGLTVSVFKILLRSLVGYREPGLNVSAAKLIKHKPDCAPYF